MATQPVGCTLTQLSWYGKVEFIPYAMLHASVPNIPKAPQFALDISTNSLGIITCSIFFLRVGILPDTVTSAPV